VTFWQQWLRQPQGVWLRKAVFQIHLWTGIGVGLYVFVISLTGSVLVYRNELYIAFSPAPILVSGAGTPLSSEALREIAQRVYPQYTVREVRPGETPNHAVEVTLARNGETIRRAFHPSSGADLGHTLPAGYRIAAWMLDLHDNLLFGETGRRINGLGAAFLTLLCASGLIIWWPGTSSWRQSVFLDPRANWKRLNWSLHSVLGCWFFLFMLLWGVTGAYLSYPAGFAAVFDFIEPINEADPVERVVDQIQYWLAYLHFGRLGGRGIPGCGRGLCDTITKAVWAVAGLVPPIMFVTGAVMWWNRVIAPARRRAAVGSENELSSMRG
jgi:uncharacterized iron-regulated membrane protein